MKDIFKFVSDYGFTIAFAVYMLNWILGSLRKRDENDKMKLDVIIKQNESFLKNFMDFVQYIMKDSEKRGVRFEKIVDKLSDERALTDKQFKPIIFLATRLLKNRLCERINQTIARNNLIMNQEEIVHEIDNMFMSEINFIEIDLNEIKYSSKKELYNIYYDNANYYIPLIKMVFAEIEPNNLIDREGYNRVSRRAINFIEEFVTKVRADIDCHYKK